MQVDVPRERASLNPCLSSPRFRTDRGRQCRSHENRLSWPHAQPVIDKDGVLPAVPPLNLPMHQQDIIYTILYCVCDIGDNVHECTLFGGLSRYVASQHALR